MIIIRSEKEAAVVAALDKLFQGDESVSILQSEDEVTMEELAASMAFNAKQSRIYIGRLERNTRKLDESMRAIERYLEPMAAYFAYLLAETGIDEVGANDLRRKREIREQTIHTPKIDGTR
jgi:hypothetical protein